MERLAALLDRANKIAVLTGAGVSVASGVPDFRSRSDYRKNGYKMEWILSENFMDSPSTKDLFWPCFKEIFDPKAVEALKPNPAHYFFADLEREGKEVFVITQNVDGLHQKAGSQNVIEIHGSLREARCPRCARRYPMAFAEEAEQPACESCGERLRPSIVLYDEDVLRCDEALEAVLGADLLLIAGTSLRVAPANLFPVEAMHNADKSPLFEMAIVNAASTPLDGMFGVCLKGKAEEIFPQIAQMRKRG